jgi:hypothetical protein
MNQILYDLAVDASVLAMLVIALLFATFNALKLVNMIDKEWRKIQRKEQ